MTRPRATVRPIAAAPALAVVLASLVLNGCATHPPAGVALANAPAKLSARWHEHRATLSGIDRFTLDARVASSGSFSVTGSLHWVEVRDQFRIHFSGPFGAGAVDIVGDPFVVRIRSGKKSYVTGQPEQFLRRHFGWTLPLRGLRYWALGLPAPTATGAAPAHLALNQAGQLRSLRQGDWTIDYADYQSAGADGAYTLPHKFVMHGQKADGEKTEFRVVVDSWHGLATNG